MSFDIRTAKPAEVRAEAERRKRNVEAGRAPTDDGWPQQTFHANNGMSATIYHGRDANVREYRLTLSWSCLVSDNKRPRLSLKRSAGGTVYAQTKAKAQQALSEQLGGCAPFTGTVWLTARFTEPNKVQRDILNFAKMIADALKGLAYVDDAQISKAIFERAGVDVDAPHVELIITEETI